MSTSLIVEAMKKEAVARKLACDIDAISLTSLPNLISDASCVLVAPQVRHRLKGVEELGLQSGKPVGLIDAVAYGRVDGKAVLEQALALTGKS